MLTSLVFQSLSISLSCPLRICISLRSLSSLVFFSLSPPSYTQTHPSYVVIALSLRVFLFRSRPCSPAYGLAVVQCDAVTFLCFLSLLLTWFALFKRPSQKNRRPYYDICRAYHINCLELLSTAACLTHFFVPVPPNLTAADISVLPESRLFCSFRVAHVLPAPPRSRCLVSCCARSLSASPERSGTHNGDRSVTRRKDGCRVEEGGTCTSLCFASLYFLFLSAAHTNTHTHTHINFVALSFSIYQSLSLSFSLSFSLAPPLTFSLVLSLSLSLSLSSFLSFFISVFLFLFLFHFLPLNLSLLCAPTLSITLSFSLIRALSLSLLLYYTHCS